jgi:hypothetical protein
MTLIDFICEFKFQGQLSKNFKLKRELRQGDPVSIILFNVGEFCLLGYAM